MKLRNAALIFGVLAALGAGAAGGYLIAHSGNHSGQVGTANPSRKILYWVSPMNPSYRRDKPGKSPMGMDLVPVYADSSGPSASDVHISSTVVANLGVRTAAVKQGTLAHQMDAVGYVGYDDDLVTSINTRADGWIEKLYVKAAGDTVRKGQPLFELFSPKRATAESEYLTALSSGMPSLVSASRERLEALGFSTAQIQSLAKARKVSNKVTQYADHGGVITALGVQEGAYVAPAMQVMKIADISSVWILVEVDQIDAAALQVGQKVAADLDAFPGRSWNGVIDYIYPDINPVTRTMKVRLRFANPDRKLQPNMYAHVLIDIAPKKDVIFIPAMALIQTGLSQRVAVDLGGGRFNICPVVAGFQSGDNIEILKGLYPGQKVVVSSQFLIDSEANLNAAALRMGFDKPGCRKAQQGKPPGPTAAKTPAANATPSLKRTPAADMLAEKENRK